MKLNFNEVSKCPLFYGWDIFGAVPDTIRSHYHRFNQARFENVVNLVKLTK